MYSHHHVILHLSAEFRSDRTIGGGVMTSYRFFKMAAIESEMYFGIKFSDGICLRRWICICLPNFDVKQESGRPELECCRQPGQEILSHLSPACWYSSMPD